MKTLSRAEVVAQVLEGVPRGEARPSAEAFAPANIALCKYWGKRDEQLNLPITSSLSIALGRLGTRTELSVVEGPDRFMLNGEPVADGQPFAVKASAFLDLFRPRSGLGFDVRTVNTVPTAAGFASSASGFAALVMAMDRLFGWGLDGARLSILARLGSGSAARSVFQGFVEWHAGSRADGMDSFAAALPNRWPDIRVGLVRVHTGAKPIGSREAMRRTVATSTLYRMWPDRAAADLETLRAAIACRAFKVLGETAEGNALAMHATMIDTRPAVLYWLPGSIAAMQRVWALRSEGRPVYFTMDAGPNLKLLFLRDASEAVAGHFPDIEIVQPMDATTTA